MTQSIDRPRHRRSDENGPVSMPFTAVGTGRPAYHAPASFPQQYAPQIPPQYAPQFSPQFPPPAPAPRSNGLATAGMVVGILAAVFSVIPIIGMVAWVLAPVGLVLSAVGLAKSAARGGRGKSIAGILLSIVALIMCMVYLASFGHAVNQVNQQSTAVHAVTYKVTTAKKSKVSVSYSQSQDDNLASGSAIGVAAPWSQNVQVSGFMGPTVTASLSPDLKNMNKSDTITCTIVQDGVQVAQHSATGPGASVSCTK